jgi:hypothetical protein
MPKLLTNNKQTGCIVPSEFRGQKWSGDTDEGRTARSAWSQRFAWGQGLMNPDDTPKTIALQRTRSIKPMFKAGFWTVNDTAKAVIEDLEPGRHQFLPIGLTNWFDEPIEGETRYLINVFYHQSSIIDEFTNAIPVAGFEQSKERMLLRHLLPKVTMDPDKLSSDVHFWHEDRYLFELFVSEEMYSRMVKIGVKLPTHEVELVAN